MKTFKTIIKTVNNFHANGQTIPAAEYLVKQYGLENPNFKGFELREIAKPEFVLFTTEGGLGGPQIIRIPENTFQFELALMLNLLAHEMVHVGQKAADSTVLDKNEREWQAYCEMLFHTNYSQIPEVSSFHKIFFAKKALEYYDRMGEGSELQTKYADQKQEVDYLIVLLS
jgi:hypothetical protein